jgi:hypothetical protein
VSAKARGLFPEPGNSRPAPVTPLTLPAVPPTSYVYNPHLVYALHLVPRTSGHSSYLFAYLRYCACCVRSAVHACLLTAVTNHPSTSKFATSVTSPREDSCSHPHNPRSRASPGSPSVSTKYGGGGGCYDSVRLLFKTLTSTAPIQRHHYQNNSQPSVSTQSWSSNTYE